MLREGAIAVAVGMGARWRWQRRRVGWAVEEARLVCLREGGELLADDVRMRTGEFTPELKGEGG